MEANKRQGDNNLDLPNSGKPVDNTLWDTHFILFFFWTIQQGCPGKCKFHSSATIPILAFLALAST